MDSIRRDLPTPKRPKTERETPLGLPMGVFLCRQCDANTTRRLSSGVFRLCFGFSAVVIRLSCKCRLKSDIRGFSTFADRRLPIDSPTLRLSGSDFPADSPNPSDSPTLRLSDSQRLSATFDFRLPTRGWLGTLIPRAAIQRKAPRSRQACRNAARPSRSPALGPQ